MDPRLYVALDVPTVSQARKLVQRLGDVVGCYKIGLQLLPIGGVELGKELKAQGKSVFYDYKLHDIGSTVESATRSIATSGADLLTVHARPEVMAAARRGRGAEDLKLLGVSVLTSLDAAALAEIGYHESPQELVMRRLWQARSAGMDGLVASPLEAAMLRSATDPDFLIVTPGVRMETEASGGQKRVATPQQALAAGASHIVVGRAISLAAEPVAAVRDIIATLPPLSSRPL